MSLSIPVNETMATIHDATSRPFPTFAVIVYQVVMWLIFTYNWVVIGAAWVIGLSLTSALGGGAFLLVRWLLGFQDEWRKDSTTKHEGPREKFMIATVGTLIFQIGLLMYLAITLNYNRWMIFGASFVAVPMLWGAVLTIACMGTY